MDANLEEKYYKLKMILADMGSAIVAYSGGVDSTLLLAVGKEALGDNIMAVTIDSPVHPRAMIEMAGTMASRLRAEQVIIKTDELLDPEFTVNPPERCYVCKHARFTKLIELANHEGIDEVAEGSQMDDTGDYRPGMAAAEELGVRSPLIEAEFYKYEVRSLSRELGLATWNMPAGTCLATRIPYDQPITREKLETVDEGERFLTELGVKDIRLRYYEGGPTARIEVNPSSIETLASAGVRERVTTKLASLGFTYVTLDLAGYRAGALNEVLDRG